MTENPRKDEKQHLPKQNVLRENGVGQQASKSEFNTRMGDRSRLIKTQEEREKVCFLQDKIIINELTLTLKLI